MQLQKITPCLWFDDKAEEAAHFYASIFKNSKVGNIMRYDEAASAVSGKPAGSVMTVEFEIDGQQFLGLNGGPMFEFTEAVSFMVNCDSQEEVDTFWAKLTEGGEESMCGWLKDKYGLSWQIVPDGLNELLSDPDPQKASKVMETMLRMKKIDITVLKQALEQVS